MSDAGYRALAAAILVRAIRDANGDIGKDVSAGRRKAIRQDARDFLRPRDALFDTCCGLLDYDPTAFSEAAKIRGKNITRGAILADRLAERQKAG